MLKCPAARLRRAILMRHVEREGGRRWDLEFFVPYTKQKSEPHTDQVK